MRRLVVSLVMLTLAIAPPSALASSQDAAATHKAIVAGYALAHAGVATIDIAQSKIESFNRKLAAECPGLGNGTPETEASQPMSYEVAVALWSIASAGRTVSSSLVSSPRWLSMTLVWTPAMGT